MEADEQKAAEAGKNLHRRVSLENGNDRNERQRIDGFYERRSIVCVLVCGSLLRQQTTKTKILGEVCKVPRCVKEAVDTV
jgi:hypothetical protein